MICWKSSCWQTKWDLKVQCGSLKKKKRAYFHPLQRQESEITLCFLVCFDSGHVCMYTSLKGKGMFFALRVLVMVHSSWEKLRKSQNCVPIISISLRLCLNSKVNFLLSHCTLHRRVPTNSLWGATPAVTFKGMTFPSSFWARRHCPQKDKGLGFLPDWQKHSSTTKGL